MAKDAFYFSHDSNARNDDKIIPLRMKYGWEGYGLFWALIERLRDSRDYTSICDYNTIAYDLRTDAAKIKSIINDFGLFAFTENGECFYSESLTNRMLLKDSRSAKAKSAANKRWGKNANAIQTHSERNADAMQVKESKVKESKEESNAPPPNPLHGSNLFRKPAIPTFEDVHRVFIQNGGTEEMAKKFYETNEGTGWYYRGSPITNYATLAQGFINSWKRISRDSPEGDGIKRMVI